MVQQWDGQYLMDDKPVLICHDQTLQDPQPHGAFKVPRSLDGFARTSSHCSWIKVNNHKAAFIATDSKTSKALAQQLGPPPTQPVMRDPGIDHQAGRRRRIATQATPRRRPTCGTMGSRRPRPGALLYRQILRQGLATRWKWTF